MNAYPCTGCRRAHKCPGCQTWENWFREAWGRINNFAKVYGVKPTTPQESAEENKEE